MNLEAFILGTGGMMPLPHRNLTSVLLRREGDLFLFDCGEATQISLKRLNLKWKKIHSIFISHMHADHVTGLPGILMLSSQVDRNEPLHIYGPGTIKDYIDANRNILDMYINYEIAVHVIDSPGVIIDHEEYTVEAFPLYHTKPCLGYSMTEKERPGVFHPEQADRLGVPRGPLWATLQSGNVVRLESGEMIYPSDVLGPSRPGRKFTFITDTSYSPKISRYAAGSDLLICEGMFEHALEATAREKRHLTARQAGMIARDAGEVKKMGLIHFSPRYIERELQLLLNEARELFPAASLCRDREMLSIKYSC